MQYETVSEPDCRKDVQTWFEVHTVQGREIVQLACRLRGRGSLRRRLTNRDRGKMFAARVARQRGSPVSSRPQSHVIDPSVATWPQDSRIQLDLKTL